MLDAWTNWTRGGTYFTFGCDEVVHRRTMRAGERAELVVEYSTAIPHDPTVHAGVHALRICVTDTGTGIPAPERENLFKPFMRSSDARRHVRGTGLGLSICSMLTRRLGGEVELVSSGPDGSVFAAELPLGKQNPDARVTVGLAKRLDEANGLVGVLMQKDPKARVILGLERAAEGGIVLEDGTEYAQRAKLLFSDLTVDEATALHVERDGQRLTAPLRTVPTHDRFGLVTVHGRPYRIVDIGLRMLSPRELFNAQGFPAGYQICDDPAQGLSLTKAEQVRMCGNSVSPPVAAALVAANLGEMRIRRTG